VQISNCVKCWGPSAPALLRHHCLLSDAPVFQTSEIGLFRLQLPNRNTVLRNVMSALSLTVFTKCLKTHLFSCSFAMIYILYLVSQEISYNTIVLYDISSETKAVTAYIFRNQSSHCLHLCECNIVHLCCVLVYKHAMSHNMRTEDVTVEVRYVRRWVLSSHCFWVKC